MAEVGWDDIIEMAGQTPVWSGLVKVSQDPPRTWCWWQVWRNARFDLGITARVYGAEPPALVGEAVRVVEGLTSGLATTLVVPSLGGVGSWSVERKGVDVAEMEPRYGASGRGRDYTSIRSKVIVRCREGRDLEPAMTAMSKFALELGWDGKGFAASGGHRW